MMTKFFSAPSCHILGDPYQTQSQRDRRATGSDHVILTWKKKYMGQTDGWNNIEDPILALLFIYSNFGEEQEGSS